VRQKTEQPHLSATVQAWCLSLFGHTAQMSDKPLHCVVSPFTPHLSNYCGILIEFTNNLMMYNTKFKKSRFPFTTE